jgi:hypothetical protein
METDGNDIADELARQGSSHPLIGPEPGLDISAKVAKEVIMDWTSRKHEEHDSPPADTGKLRAFLKKKAGQLLILS